MPGAWEGGKPLTFTYQWRRCDAAGANCAPISGATAESYRPVSADVGHSLKVFVTATSAAGARTPRPFRPPPSPRPARSPGARPTNLKPPQILGTPQDGQILTSSVGTWTGSPTKFTYRWRRCNASGASCIAIPHATGPRRTLTPDDIGSTLSLVVTATGKGGATSATTSATGVVVAAPLPPVSIGTQTVRRGVAGNLQTDDGRATVTWQPGAVPVGQDRLARPTFSGALSAAGQRGLALGAGAVVEGIPVAARPQVRAAAAEPDGARLLDGREGLPLGARRSSRRSSRPARRSAGTSTRTTSTHVLTRTPFQVALFKQGAWGDPDLHLAERPGARDPDASSRPSPIRPTTRLLLLDAARGALAGADVGVGDRPARA